MLRALLKTIDFIKDLRHKRLFSKISVTTLICICVAYLTVWVVYLAPQMMAVSQAWHHLLADYVNIDEVNSTQLYNKALDGLQSSLINRDTSISQGMIDSMLELIEDKHTVYFSADQYDMFMNSLSGTFKGIGVWMQENDEGHIIISPIPESPAEEAGIFKDDRIVEIDGQSTEGMSIDEAGLLIRGEPQTQVILTILREGQTTPIPVPVTRDEVTVPSVLAEEIEENIIYAKLYSFSGTAGDELITGLNNLLDDDTAGIIIDLRDNPGGVVSDAILVCSQFVNEDDDIMHEIDGIGNVNHTYESSKSEINGLNANLRVAVLQNEGSASASEIVAGALQDLRSNTSVIGTTSYGKGSAQTIIKLVDGSAIKITFTYWTTPNGSIVNGVGITPDEVIEGEEAQLQAAIDYVKNS